MKKLISAFLLILTAIPAGMAQNSFYDDYNNFLKQAREEYNSFREKANQEYADFLAAPWESIKLEELTRPLEKTRPPKPLIEEEYGREDNSINYDRVVNPVMPEPQPRPQPVEPVTVTPRTTDRWVTFSYLGNVDKVREPSDINIRINDLSESGIAAVWKDFSKGYFDATLSDCLALRDKYNLPDWAYLNMLDVVANKIFPRSKNDATLLTAWLYSQSGYKMRLARDGGSTLVIMFGTNRIIYGRYYTMDGTNYFPFKHKPSSLSISHASFPNEKQMRLELTSLPKTTPRLSEPRKRKSKSYPEMDYDLRVDENLMEFFNTYPNSQVGNDMMTRWALYANTPLSNEVKEQLYPVMRQNIKNLSERDKVQHILNWVQTGFVYEYDDKVWGEDRAFFPDETIFYPYADCEDRAILFTRLVRDLVGLDAILVYYPGHLASAIAFTGNEAGDYITLNGRRFTVCDPTIITGAPVGRTGSSYDNSSATVILLKP